MKKLFLAAAFLFCAWTFVFAQETEIQFLSGHGKDDAVPWKFFCIGGAQSGYWTNLVVPSNWELHGFGTLTYHRDVTNQPVDRGLYEHEFFIPTNWSGKRIFLVFDGVMTDTSAKLNDKSAGPTHQGGYYQFKYEVTSLAKFGATNQLEVAVDKHSANKSINGAERTGDYWMYGGIFRPVYLEAVPPQFIERVAIDAKADGSFSMDVFLNGVTNGEAEAQIQTLDGKDVGTIFEQKISGKKISLQTKIISPKLWTAETPNLYKVKIRLTQNGKIIHQIEQRFGFRTFEVRDGDGLYLNGQKIILKGCCRHSFWPDSGRCLSEAIDRLDIETMKDMNMNAVRMTHYPPDAEFLDLCDELGLYVLDELGGWHKFYDTKTGKKLVGEMVTHDVNHPSILFWDNGNEGGFNTNLDKIFGEYDPQNRRVLHPWASFDGLCTAHYMAYNMAEIAGTGQSVYYSLKRKLELVATDDHTKYIYMPTEFLHANFDGGAGAGLEDFWRVMSASKLLGGGFIWAFLDEGVNNPFTKKIDVAGNQAPDGIVGPYREREASFYTIKKIWSPIQIARETNGTFAVENHYSFTDANQCEFKWELRKFSLPSATNADFEILAEGKIAAPSIPPGGKGVLQFDLPADWDGADALALQVNDPNGRELWTWVWPASDANQNQFRSDLMGVSASQPATATETNRTIFMKAADLTVAISKDTGLLAGVQRGSQFFSLANGPRPALGKKVRLIKLTRKQDGSDYVVTEKFFGELKSVVWRMHAGGWLQCDYRYKNSDLISATQNFFGVTFDYPENLVKSKRWLGDGPYRVWKNRIAGTTLGVWQNDYNNTITGFRDWIYPEFKGIFADVRWLQLDTTEGQITVVPKNVPFVQVLTPEFPPTNLVLNAIVSLPKCGLGFLDAIPAIGSSTKKAADLGPQSQPNVAHGEYSGSVSFYFGNLPANKAN